MTAVESPCDSSPKSVRSRAIQIEHAQCAADAGSAPPLQLVHPLDPSRPVIQSWQSPSQQILPPAENSIPPATSEPFQRAAEIVAAAATEAAAAAASVVVSAASKKIKEQLEGLYSRQGVQAGLAPSKSVRPALEPSQFPQPVL